ncbi:unnamed protein product [Closterium sp. Naga37s-1]|nr:unnamed protein product [Closterium sp. Naga37s-1]
MECPDCSLGPFYVYSALESHRGSAACRIAAASRGAEASDSPPIQPPARRRRVWSPSRSENVFVPPTFDEPADDDGVEAAAARAADDPEAFMARMSDSSGIEEVSQIPNGSNPRPAAPFSFKDELARWILQERISQHSHTPSLPAIYSAMPGSPYLSLTILMHFQHILSLPASHSAMPASPNLSLTVLIHTTSLPAPHSAIPLYLSLPAPLYLSLPFLLSPALPSRALPHILDFHPSLPLPAIPSLPCASLSRLAPHSGFPVPLYLSLPFLLSPALPSRALPHILDFQSLSTSPCHSFSPLRFPLAPCPTFWFSSPSLPLPAIPSLPCASLSRIAPHSGFPVPLYLSLPFLLSPALPSRALPHILVFQSLSTSPCHSFSPLRFPLAHCPTFWISSPSLPLPAIPSLPCASLSRIAPSSGFPVPLYLSLPFLHSPALPSRALPLVLDFQSLSTSPCHSFSPLRFPLAHCPTFWISSPSLPLPAIPSLPCASLSRIAPSSGFPVPLYLSLPFLLSPALPSRALPHILVFQSLSTSPCHSFSPLRFPLAHCPTFWISSPSLPVFVSASFSEAFFQPPNRIALASTTSLPLSFSRRMRQ